MKRIISPKVLTLVMFTTLLLNCKKDETNPELLSSTDEESLQSTFDTSSLSNGLVAYFPFKGDLFDYSGNNHNGTVIGAISYGFNRKGRKNSALVLGSGRVVTDNFFNFQRTDSFSITMWFTLNTNSSGGRLISNECPEGNFRISAYSNGIYAIAYGSSTYYIYDTVALNSWTHIVYTYSNRHVKLYKNGVLKYSGINNDTEPLHYCAPFTIGAKASAAYDKWQGSIENLRVYSRALSKSEARYLSKH